MKNLYIVLENADMIEIITRYGFSKEDKLKDFLDKNKGSKIRLIFE